MSRIRNQISFACECEEAWGSVCNKHTRLILEHNCSVDYTSIYILRHVEDGDQKYRVFKCEAMNDNTWAALTDLLNEENLDSEIDVEFLNGTRVNKYE